MTRETKVGIVVACSFLGLLGVVVTSKLRGERPPDKEETPTTTAALSAKPRSAPNSKAARSATGWLSNLLVKAKKTEALVLVAAGDIKAPPPAPQATPLPPLADPTQAQPATEAPAPPVPGGGDPPPTPAPPAKPAEIDAAPPAGGEVNPISASPPDVSVKWLGPLAILFPNVRAETKRNTAEIGAALIEKKKQVVGEVSAVAPPASGPASEVGGEGTKLGTIEVPAPTVAEPTAEAKKAVVPLPPAPADSVPGSPPPAGEEPIAAPPPIVAPLATPAAKKDRHKPLEGAPEVPVLRPVGATTTGGEAEESPGASLDRRLAPAAVLAPVVARTTPSSKPKVEVFSVEEYPVQAGDTFATISKAKYHSENYAEALRLFNANDALLSDAGRDAAINLQPGQTISIPDLTILEKRYSHAIKGLPAGGGLVPATGTSRKTEFDVRPVVGVRTVPGAAPTYEIRQEGVTMREVAAQTLGNGDRWNEILKLNKEYTPERALPVGVVLKLPADARVPVPVPVPAVP